MYALTALLAASSVTGCSSTPEGSSASASSKATGYYTQLGVAYLQKDRLDFQHRSRQSCDAACVVGTARRASGGIG